LFNCFLIASLFAFVTVRKEPGRKAEEAPGLQVEISVG